MNKIVVLGSCKYAPYTILLLPNKLDPNLYEIDHEKAYEEACKVVFPKIDKADEIWVYAPDGIGEHTLKDLEYAKQQGKKIMVLVNLEQKGSGELTDLFFHNFYQKLRKEKAKQ